MARVARNIVTQGLSGMIGGALVFRQRGEETIVSQAPGKQDRPATEAEKAHRSKFGMAILYGKGVNTDATSKGEYAKQAQGNQSAFNVAVADFMSAPEIDEIDVTNYTGAVGSTIRVRAMDDFLVSRVLIIVENSDGTIADQGDAVLDANGLDWIWTATTNNASLTGDKITVRVNDLPGNETEKIRNL